MGRVGAFLRHTRMRGCMYTHPCTSMCRTIQTVGVPVEYCYQSCLEVLQRKLQRKPGRHEHTQHTERTHVAVTGALGSLQLGFSLVIPLHQRAAWCAISLAYDIANFLEG